jgi:hypothetical protein
MKSKVSRLVLHKETLRTLTRPELSRVHGGFETAYEDEATNCIPGTNTCPGGGCGGTGGCNTAACSQPQHCGTTTTTTYLGGCYTYAC